MLREVMTLPCYLPRIDQQQRIIGFPQSRQVVFVTVTQLVFRRYGRGGRRGGRGWTNGKPR